MTVFTPVPFTGEATIPDTPYALMLTRENNYGGVDITLVNKTTGEQNDVVGGIGPQGYALFYYQDRLHLIARIASGGSNSAFNYGIMDISGSTPRLIDWVISCSNPRLNGDILEFYTVPETSHCDTFPFETPGRLRVTTIKLS